MPTISIFFGMVIQMYWRDHPPAHFHVLYQGYLATIAIETGEVLEGELPRAARRILREWAARHRHQLLANWDRGKLNQSFSVIQERMKMIEYVNVAELKALDGFRLWLRFSNGSSGVRDFSDILAAGGEVIEPIRDETMFRRAFLSMGVPTWPTGLQLDPSNLYLELAERHALQPAAAAE